MNKIFKAILIFNFSLLIINSVNAQFTHQDTFAAVMGREEIGGMCLYYKINVTPDYNTKSIIGRTKSHLSVTKQTKE